MTSVPVPRPSEGTRLTKEGRAALVEVCRRVVDDPAATDDQKAICGINLQYEATVAALEAELARRSPSVPTATQEQRDARAEEIKEKYASRTIGYAEMNAQLARLKPESTSSEEAANSDTDQSAGEIIVNRDEWYAAKKDAERMNWLESKVDHQAADAYLRLEFDTHKTLRESADDERPAARVQGENSQ